MRVRGHIRVLAVVSPVLVGCVSNTPMMGIDAGGFFACDSDDDCNDGADSMSVASWAAANSHRSTNAARRARPAW